VAAMTEYATADDLAAYPGGSAVPNTDAPVLLARANRFLNANVFRFCWFQCDADGIPTDTTVRQAFTDAVCAQVVWWDELGDSTGATGAGWGDVAIGSVRLARSGTAASDGSDSPARQIAAEVWDVLQQPDLTPDILTIGLVIT
jgi:hypothetical protein